MKVHYLNNQQFVVLQKFSQVGSRKKSTREYGESADF